MSEGLFSFSDYDAVAANARLLYLAFGRDICDPEYMPATRDISVGKRRMLINWLAGFLKQAPPTAAPLPEPPIGLEPPASLVHVMTGPDHPTRRKPSAARAARKAVGAGSDVSPAAPSAAAAAIATRGCLRAFMFISLGWVEVWFPLS
jgi:hypothetical protein